MDEPKGPYHVLVVDDEPANIEIIKRRLERRGFRVSTGDSAQAAYDAIAVQRPDLVLLDIMMPEVSGLEVLERLRSDPLTSNLPVILVSALADTDDIVRGLQAGANDYVTKPIDMPVLLARIETHIKGAAMLRTSERRAELLMRLAQVDAELIRTMQQKADLVGQDVKVSTASKAKTVWEREPTVDLAAPAREKATSEYLSVGNDDAAAAETPARKRTESTLFYLLETEVAKCLSNRSDLSLLVWESQQVDELTEKHGRPVGVELLGKLVDRVSAALEPGAVLCGYQSPAFCVVLGGSGLSAAASVAEKVVDAVVSEPFSTEIGEVELTCDVGVASFEVGQESSPLEVVERAVCALDQARNSTRSPIWLARASGLLTPHHRQ